MRTFLIYDGTHSVPYITALTRLWAKQLCPSYNWGLKANNTVIHSQRFDSQQAKLLDWQPLLITSLPCYESCTN